MDPYTAPEESQSCFPSDINYLFSESLADISTFSNQLHHLNDRINNHISHPSPAQSTSTQSAFDTPISMTTCTVSPPSACETLQNDLKGKVEIDRVSRTHKCPTCEKKFYGDISYKRHIQSRKCLREFRCLGFGCDKSFALKKDLQRHRGSCKSNKKSKHCACTCDNRYARKDELNRHMKNKNVDKTFPDHRCQACDLSRCIC